MKRVFIGGMGRSGTTITLNALYQHGELTAIPIETKFLVEADGFYDLVEALTCRFSTAATPVVLERFRDLMRNRVTGLLPSSFSEQHDLSSRIFRNYEEGVERLAEILYRRNYFHEREEVLQATRNFIGMTFDDLANISNKPGWVEKTPANLWRIEFLRELWPDSFFVHLMRDPRLIFLSLLEKKWLPSELDAALGVYSDMTRAMVLKRRTLLGLPRFIEIRLEDLEGDMAATLGRLASGLDLSPFSADAIAGIESKVVRYAESKALNPAPIRFSADEAAVINQSMLPFLEELGYPLQFPAEALQANPG